MGFKVVYDEVCTIDTCIRCAMCKQGLDRQTGVYTSESGRTVCLIFGCATSDKEENKETKCSENKTPVKQLLKVLEVR